MKNGICGLKKLESLDNVNVLLRTDQDSYCKAIGEKKQNMILSLLMVS